MLNQAGTMPNDKTILARRKFYRGKKLTEEELLTIENADRRDALVVKLLIKIVKSWWTYVTAFLATAFAELASIINLIE